MRPPPSIRAWRPELAGVSEVLHAYFPEHAYPLHTHDTWTLLIVDTGSVVFDLERHEHVALRNQVTLLPPGVPHDGRSATVGGFRKRVVYLDADALDLGWVGNAVDQPGWSDPRLRGELHLLHQALLHPGDGFEAESRLALVRDRLTQHLTHAPVGVDAVGDPGLARRLRSLLDDHLVEGMSLATASEMLGAHPTHLVRTFRREVGIAPHTYLTGRRLDRARRLLLAGRRPAEVAVEVGFYDQAHLGRHFKRFLGVSPGEYAVRATGSRGQ